MVQFFSFTEQTSVAGFCEHGDERVKFIDQHSDE